MLLLDKNLSKITFVKRKWVTVTNHTTDFVFIFIILNTHANFQLKVYPREEVDFVIFFYL